MRLDRDGLQYTPLPALASLHQDYHFARHHSIAGGATEALPEVSAFGSALHVHRLFPPFALISNAQGSSGAVATMPFV